MVCKGFWEAFTLRYDWMLVNVSLGSLLPSSFQRELSAQRRRVQQLEAYLGGELPSEGSGLTWREERSTLTTRIRVGEGKEAQMA